jgi:hypothetical protein
VREREERDVGHKTDAELNMIIFFSLLLLGLKKYIFSFKLNLVSGSSF